jgi:benzoyl-CoA 2,3-epoxidase subunit A
MQTGTEKQTPVRQHLIDPETCIRCNTCESRCPTKAISHERNYVVDPERCNYCMRCVRPCPTGAVDHWFIVARPYSVAEQLSWSELPKPAEPSGVKGAVEDVLIMGQFGSEQARRVIQGSGMSGAP